MTYVMGRQQDQYSDLECKKGGLAEKTATVWYLHKVKESSQPIRESMWSEEGLLDVIF